MMYEPPNRGGKTWAALGRVTVDPGGNGDDPGSAITNPTVLANSFLMPRGYTMVWSGWEDWAPSTPSTRRPTSRSPRFRRPLRIRPEPLPPVLRIHRGGERGCVGRVELPGGDAGQDPGDADPPRSSQRRAAGRSRIRLELQRGGNGDQPRRRELPRERHLRVRVHRERPRVSGLGFAAVRDWMEFLRYERRDDHNNPNPLARHIRRVYTEISSQPGRLLNDFRHLGFNETENGRKASTATCSGSPRATAST